MVSKKIKIIYEAKKIIDSYSQKMTLRQIYYRLVAKGIIDNTISQYKRLSSILVYAREIGYIDPFAIEDRHRDRAKVPDDTYRDKDDFFKSELNAFLDSHKYYRLPKWLWQPVKVIVSLEKDALSGIFSSITSQLGCGLIVGKGYNSYTQIHDLAKQLEEYDDTTKKIVMLYFADFDPTGKDIVRSLKERLEKKCPWMIFEHHLIALTEQQIKDYNLPPAPTKKTDSRAAQFIERYGDVAVELDAIEPIQLKDLIKNNVLKFFDESIHSKVQNEIEMNRAYIKELTNVIKKSISTDFKWAFK